MRKRWNNPRRLAHPQLEWGESSGYIYSIHKIKVDLWQCLGLAWLISLHMKSEWLDGFVWSLAHTVMWKISFHWEGIPFRKESFPVCSGSVMNMIQPYQAHDLMWPGHTNIKELPLSFRGSGTLVHTTWLHASELSSIRNAVRFPLSFIISQ